MSFSEQIVADHMTRQVKVATRGLRLRKLGESSKRTMHRRSR